MSHLWLCASPGIRVLKAHDQYFVAFFWISFTGKFGQRLQEVLYFLSSAKCRQRLFLQFIGERETLLKWLFIISFIFEAASEGAKVSTNLSESQLKIYGPVCYFVLPNIFRTKVTIAVISTIFRFFLFFLRFLQELSELLFFRLVSK